MGTKRAAEQKDVRFIRKKCIHICFARGNLEKLWFSFHVDTLAIADFYVLLSSFRWCKNHKNVCIFNFLQKRIKSLTHQEFDFVLLFRLHYMPHSCFTTEKSSVNLLLANRSKTHFFMVVSFFSVSSSSSSAQTIGYLFSKRRKKRASLCVRKH